MNTSIQTLEDFCNNVTEPLETFNIPDFLNIHLFDLPNQQIPFHILGYLSFNAPSMVRSIRRYFLLSTEQGGLVSEKQCDENEAVVRVSECLESRWSLDHIKVTDICLPRSHGFSKNLHNVDIAKRHYYRG